MYGSLRRFVFFVLLPGSLSLTGCSATSQDPWVDGGYGNLDTSATYKKPLPFISKPRGGNGLDKPLHVSVDVWRFGAKTDTVTAAEMVTMTATALNPNTGAISCPMECRQLETGFSIYRGTVKIASVDRGLCLSILWDAFFEPGERRLTPAYASFSKDQVAAWGPFPADLTAAADPSFFECGDTPIENERKPFSATP